MNLIVGAYASEKTQNHVKNFETMQIEAKSKLQIEYSISKIYYQILFLLDELTYVIRYFLFYESDRSSKCCS